MELKHLYHATQKQLTPARWEHSLRVVETAKQLCERYQIASDRAEVAAILHDYCKYWSKEKLIAWIKNYQVGEEYLKHDKELWHAPVGAEVARHEFNITDEEILNAIRYHTSGRPGMSLIEKVIYLADYIEPNRKYPGIEEVRELAKTSVDQAVLLAMENTILFLIHRRRKVFPLTLHARNDMLDQVNELCLKEESF